MARRTLAGEVDVAFCAWVKWEAACRLHHRQKQQHAHHGGATCPTGATSCSFWLLALLAAGTRMPQPCQQALGTAHLGGARPAVDVCPHEADAGIDGLQTHACGQIRLCQQMVVTMWPWWWGSRWQTCRQCVHCCTYISVRRLHNAICFNNCDAWIVPQALKRAGLRLLRCRRGKAVAGSTAHGAVSLPHTEWHGS